MISKEKALTKNENPSRAKLGGNKISKSFSKFLKISFIFLIFTGWIFSGWPEIKKANAAVGTQHEFAWGLDKSNSSTMGSRSNTGNDVRIAIKAGASAGSDTDPILRVQIVPTGAIATGERLGLYFTDCAGVTLKACATRVIGTNPATQWVPVEPQNAVAGGLFRFREAAHASVVGGNQISGVVGVTEHNPTAGAWGEGSTVNAYSTSAFTSATYPAHDFSLEYYGPAPSVFKTYIFAATYNEVLPGWSGMHASTGAILDILPANWTGSAITLEGASITSATTATATIIFTDDSNQNSTTAISYSLTESGTYTTPAACTSITTGYNSFTAQDGLSVHKRTCDITGLTANSIYFIKVIHTDADGISGDATQILGPFYTDQTKAAIHMHVDTGDTAPTTDDITDVKEDDAGAIATAVAVGDGQLTLLRTEGRFQVDAWAPGPPINATLNSTQLRYQYGTNNNNETAQNFYRASAGTEPALCSALGTGGTNWNLVATLPINLATWYAEATATLTGYTAAQLETLDLCLSNTNNSGGAASDVVAFDFISIIPIFTPAASGAGAPTAVTETATFISSNGAQLNSVVTTQGIAGVAYFEYGTTVSYGSFSPNSTGEYIYNSIFSHSVGSQAYWRTISGLSAGTTYNFRVCLKASPSAAAICGANQTFTTPAASTLTFSLGANAVALGALSSGAVSTGSHTIIVGTNATNGMVVTYSGSTLTSGANTVTAMSTAAASSLGTEQFGINTVANTTPTVGVACSGTVPIAAAAIGYATANNFKFVTGETIVSSAGSINDTTCTISYIANISNATEAGIYNSTLTYIVTANF